ncbi:uncharacterized protein LOC133849308 [Drosophila sulfurigaster albostrigata]|uniref:uncharacterized protein LOC133849308 n=1 Tax=Drosophila sulfurigaster albostrigata TaxID=89887 RepID=UPI002D21865E|nr:uncharacterized protein LOC133849308 [Drosophila sulfurigaster albostrigata]
MELLKSINNKEIFMEVLHLSIDFLIGNINDQQALRLSHKYGFQNPDDFLLATRTISKYYRNCCLDSVEAANTDKLAFLSQELRPLVPLVLASRQDAVESALSRYEYLKNNVKCVMSFDWDTRLILGDSSSRSNVRQVVTINLHCRSSAKDELIMFEMNLEQLKTFIEVLENSLKSGKAIK